MLKILLRKPTSECLQELKKRKKNYYLDTKYERLSSNIYKSKEQIFQINVTDLKIPTGRRQTSWLFTERDRGFELGTTKK